jgi:hypothetical protein
MKHQEHGYYDYYDHDDHQPDDHAGPPAAEVWLPQLIQCCKLIQCCLQPCEECYWNSMRIGT